MKALVLVLTVLTLILQYRLWVGDGSLSEVWVLSQAVASQQEKNDLLQARNQALEAEVRDLKKGTEAIEERARSELGMIIEGETFYQVLDVVPAMYKKANLSLGTPERKRRRPPPALNTALSNSSKTSAPNCKDPTKCYLPGFGP